MQFITENFKTILLALIGLFAGIAITIKVRKGNKTNNTNKANQKNNKVEGDMSGRDINK